MPLPIALPPPLPPVHAPRHCIVREDEGARAAAGRPSAVGSMVSELYPIKVHWDDTFTEKQALLVLESTELAWAVQVDQLGYRAPVLPDTGDGPELDLYLNSSEAGAWSAWTLNDTSTDDIKGDGLFGVSAYIVFGQISDEWLPSYAAHEFNHVLQYGMDYSEWFINFWESHATAAQKWTLGEPDYSAEVSSWQKVPYGPSLVGDSYLLWPEIQAAYSYEYGAVVWALYMDEKYGDGDGTMGPTLWYAAANEGWSYEPDHMDAVIDVGGPLGPVLDGLAVVRYLTGDRWDDRGLEEAQTWGAGQEVTIDTELGLSDLPMDFTFADPLMITGQGFVHIDVGGGSTDTLTVSVADASGDHESSFVLMWWNTDGSVGDTLADDDVSGANPVRTLDLTGVDELVIGVTNLGPPTPDYDWIPPTKTGAFVLDLSLDGDGDTGPIDTGGDTGAAPAPTGTDSEEDGGKCGCDGADAPWWLALGAPMLLMRRSGSVAPVPRAGGADALEARPPCPRPHVGRRTTLDRRRRG